MIQSCLELERGIVVMIPDIGKLIDKTKKELEHVCKYRTVILTPSQWNDITTTYEKLYPKTTVYQVGGHTLIIENGNADDESENTGAVENDNDDQVTYISCQEFPVLSCLFELDKALSELNEGLKNVCGQAGLKRKRKENGPNIFRYLPRYLDNDPAEFFNSLDEKNKTREFSEQYDKLHSILDVNEEDESKKPETSESEPLSQADLHNLYNFLFKLKLLQNVSSQKSKNKNSKGDEKSHPKREKKRRRKEMKRKRKQV